MPVISRTRRTIYIIIPIFIMAFIFWQSALPADVSQSESGFLVSLIRQFWHADPETISHTVRKCAHFTEYLLLGWSLFFAMRIRFFAKKCFLYAWIIGTAYAVTDEIHQIFVDGRSCEALDVLIDSAGILAGIGIAWIIYRHKTNKEASDDGSSVPFS